MRIAFVAPLVTPIREPQLGGSQALLADIAGGLTKRGHEVSVYASTGSSIDGVHVVDSGIDSSDLADTFFRSGTESRASDAAIDAFRRVYGLVAEGEHDIVHNHAFDVPAITCAQGITAPVVHTMHLPPDEAVADALNYSRKEGTVVVACVSRSHADAWRAAHTQIDIVLRNGVPLDRIPWSAEAEEGALFAGRFSPEKGAAEAIEIAKRAGTQLVLVGSPYDEDYVASRIEPHRGDPGIEVCDALPRSELWNVMSRSRAVLCPVSWDEPFGLVAAEAQACGAPVIAFARGGLVEVVKDGVTGVLVDDVEAAARELKNVERIERQSCREHAEKNLSLESTLDAHEALYVRLTNRQQASIG